MRITGSDFRQQAGQLGAAEGPERIEGIVVTLDLTTPQRVDDRAEEEDLVTLVRPAEKDSRLLPLAVGDELLHQAALADPRLADDSEEPAAPHRGAA